MTVIRAACIADLSLRMKYCKGCQLVEQLSTLDGQLYITMTQVHNFKNIW